MFTASTIINELGLFESSSDALFVTGFLLFIENKLRTNYGLEFGVVSSLAKPTQDFEDQTMLIPINFCRDITTVKIKEYGSDSEETLTLNTDFLLRKHRVTPNPAFELRLLSKCVSLPKYIEITGKYSFAETVPQDIYQAVLETLKVALGNYKYNSELETRGGKSVSRTKIGDVEVSFGSSSSNRESNRESNYESIFSNSSLQIVLNNYLC